MPVLKSDQLEASLRSGKIGMLYGFDGPENWLKERAVKQIFAKLIPKEAKDFNFEQLDGRQCTGAQIVNAAQSLPFLGDRRLVVVQATDELSTADARAVSDTLVDLPPTTCLIFLFDGKANLRDEIPAQVGSLGTIVTFWTPFANQLPMWVMSESKLRGKTIMNDAAMLLAESCSDLQQISNELDKLCLFVGDKKIIDSADVRGHGLPDEVGDTKELEAAIWTRNSREALQQGRLLSEVGVRGEAIFPICERVFRSLLLAQNYLTKKRMPWEEIYSAFNMRGKTQQGNLMRGVKAYRPEELEQSLQKVMQADYDLKTGALPSEMAVSLLLWNLTGIRHPGMS